MHIDVEARIFASGDSVAACQMNVAWNCILCMWLAIVYCVCMFDHRCVGSSLRSTLCTSHSSHQLYVRASTELLFFLYHYLMLLLLLKFVAVVKIW